MTDDRELLELAANAAGNIEYFWTENGNLVLSDSDGKQWNPLTDDGEALRLAVKLEITIYTPQTKTMKYDIACAQNFDGEIDCCEKTASDPYAATRRAIVRAAAEIGKLK